MPLCGSAFSPVEFNHSSVFPLYSTARAGKSHTAKEEIVPTYQTDTRLLKFEDGRADYVSLSVFGNHRQVFIVPRSLPLSLKPVFYFSR